MLLRVNVVDYPTGACVYEKTSARCGPETHTPGVCSLIASLFQMSASLGAAGAASQMHTTFDSMQGAEEPGRKRLSFFGSGAVTRCSLARLDYAVGHAIIVAVFYSAPLPSAAFEAAPMQLGERFLELYVDALRALAPVFDDLADEKRKSSVSVTPAEILRRFQDFCIPADLESK